MVFNCLYVLHNDTYIYFSVVSLGSFLQLWHFTMCQLFSEKHIFAAVGINLSGHLVFSKKICKDCFSGNLDKNED